MFQEAEKLESSGQKASAYRRYEEAADRLRQFKKDNADWEPGIVNYRLRFAEEKLNDLKGAADAKPGATPAPAPQMKAAPTGDELPTATVVKSKDAKQDAETAALRRRLGELEQELDRTKQELAQVSAERDSLRDRLATTEKQLADAKSNAVDSRMADLMAENTQLKAKLGTTEDELARLRTAGAGDASGVAGLQAELKTVRALLDEQKQQNVALGQTNAELQRSLEEAKSRLALAGGGAGDLARENEMMRSIIQRQLQEQARRDAARKLAQEELQTMQVKSDVLQRQLEILGSPLVQLSAEETTLLRLPETSLADSNDLRASLSASTGAAAGNATTASASTAPSTTNNDLTSPAIDTDPEETVAGPASTAPASTTAAASTLNVPADYRSRPRVPEDMRAVAAQATDLFNQRKFDDAAARYNTMLQRYPDSLYAWSNLGVVRFQQQKYDEAKKALQEAVKLAPNDGFSHSVLGIVYYQMGKQDEAITALTRASALEPKDAKTRNYLGIALAQKGWQEAAEKECRKAVELDPGYADAHFNLAVLYATQKPPAKQMARKHYQRAVELGVPKEAGLEKLIQ